MSVLWNHDERRLRAGWRLLLQAILMLVLGGLPILLVAEPLTALHKRGLFLPALAKDEYDRVINMIIGPLLTAGVVASVLIAARFLDRRPFHELGVRIDRRWWSGLFLGIAVSTFVMAAVFAFELSTGRLTITDTFAISAITLSFSLLKALCVGTYEEFVSRGYLLTNLTDGVNRPFAILASSAVFAALHAGLDNATALSMLGLFVNGLYFTAALLLTGRLSAAIGAHIGWNFAEGVLFGFPVSGDKESANVIVIAQHGAEFITGGDFGPEGGVVGIAASLLGIAALALTDRSTLTSSSSPPL